MVHLNNEEMDLVHTLLIQEEQRINTLWEQELSETASIDLDEEELVELEDRLEILLKLILKIELKMKEV